MSQKLDLQDCLAGLSSAELGTGIPNRPDGAIPLSFAQQRIWFLEQLEPGNPTYNDHFAFRLRGELDVPRLEWSLNAVVQRHEALRTVFRGEDGEVGQVILPDLTVPLTMVDLRDIDEAVRELEVHRICYHDAQRPFDLTTGPLLRATVLQVGHTDHVLVLTIHRIVTDGWSLNVLVRELSAHYTELSTGNTTTPNSLPIQYADYAHWQRNVMQGEALNEKLAYWQQQLGGTLPVLELPTDRPRPALQTFTGATRSFELGQELSQRLETLSQQEGVTLFMMLLTAYKVLLYRYTGQEDVMVGTPIAGRNHEETETLIGVLVNTLVLRSKLGGGLTFRDVLKEVRKITLDAYDHQDMPFEILVEVLQPERNQSQSPLFQVMFIQQGDPLKDVDWPEVSVECMHVEKGTAKFDLTLVMVPEANGWVGKWEYNTDLFDGATIERMAGHYETLLQGIVQDPDSLITHLPLLTSAEQDKMLVQWNNTKRDYASDKCIHQLFEEQVERTPDEVAVIFEDRQLTFAELNMRANQLARKLQQMGVTHDQLVGISMDRSLEMMIGLLAIHKAGGAYVPLDPSYPTERLAFMIEDAGMNVLVTQSNLVSLFPPARADRPGVRVLCYDRVVGELAREDARNLENGMRPDHLAYVIYTSGSTGQPKGVEITQRNVVNFYAGMDRRVGCGRKDTMLAITSIGSDISVLELFWTLARGCKVVLFSKGGTMESVLRTGEEVAAGVADHSLQAQIQRHAVSMLQCTPSLMKTLVENEAAMQALQSLRVILLGGEALPTALAHRLRTELLSRLVNMYGSTEATVWASTYEVLDVQPIVSIGSPIVNYQMYVLDANLQPVPIGVPGELHIGGVGLARGYRNRPELTAEKFIHNPFSMQGEARLYKTGDLVRWLPNGTLEYLDRIDRRRALPAPERQVAATGAYIEPRTALEQQIAGIWGEVLHLERVSIHDSFFSIGGHSLLATKVIVRMNRTLRVSLALRTLFETPTIATLAQTVEKLQRTSPSPSWHM